MRPAPRSTLFPYTTLFRSMLGIVIGVGAVIVMIAVGAGAQRRVEEQIRALGSNLLLVMPGSTTRSEEHTSELQSPCKLVCRLLLEKKNRVPQRLFLTRKIN